MSFQRPFRFTSTFLVSLLVLAGCSSKIKIQTEPSEAKIFVSQENNINREFLGQSPFEISYNDLLEKSKTDAKSGDFLILTFEGKDNEYEKVLLPIPVFGTKSTQLFVKMNKSASKSDITNHEVLSHLHSSQKLVYAGKFQQALAEIDKVLVLEPNFERALTLKGSVYYLQKKYPEAIKWFQKALEVDPSFTEANEILNKIKAETQK